MTVKEILSHGKLRQSNHGLGHGSLKEVKDFYNRDGISWVVPHKNAIMLITNNDGIREPVYISEKTVDKIFEIFVTIQMTK